MTLRLKARWILWMMVVASSWFALMWYHLMWDVATGRETTEWSPGAVILVAFVTYLTLRYVKWILEGLGLSRSRIELTAVGFEVYGFWGQLRMASTWGQVTSPFSSRRVWGLFRPRWAHERIEWFQDGHPRQLRQFMFLRYGGLNHRQLAELLNNWRTEHEGLR
jgi:hypothetical protein